MALAQELVSPTSEPSAPMARLAPLVRILRSLEDGIEATIADAERTLRDLEARGIHVDGGFESADRLENRMLRPTPMLRALIATAPGETHRGEERRGPRARKVQSDRAKRVKALETLSASTAHIRALEDDLRHKVEETRHILGQIETEQVYDECGYTSYEDFLERALGPSPMLAAALALLDREAPLAPVSVPDDLRAAPPANEAPSAPVGQDVPASLLGAGAAAEVPPAAEAPAVSTPQPFGAKDSSPEAVADGVTQARRPWVLAMALALVASTAGATVGALSGAPIAVPPAPEAPAPALSAAEAKADIGQPAPISPSPSVARRSGADVRASAKADLKARGVPGSLPRAR